MLALSARGTVCGETGPRADVVVLVPGVTGSMLRERDSQRVVWGRGVNLVRPHDGGYELARPLALRSSDPSRLEAFDVVREIRLGRIFHKKIYGPVVEQLEAAGLRRGDISRPDAEASLYLFAWDWRADHVRAAAALAERLDAIRAARGGGAALRVSLVCQSSGALICRYLAKFGDVPLESAERGEAAPPAGLELVSLVLVGTANGGSLRNLRELDRGRDYVALIGRKWEPEVLFTFPALYQDLPSYRDDFFVDESGRAVDVDLFDPASWERYGWSLFDRRAQRRLTRADRPSVFGDAAGRRSFLAWALDRARRLQAVMMRDGGWRQAPRYYLVQNDSSDTPDRAVLVARRDGTWRTLFGDDADVRRDERLARLTVAPGDGHATVASQMRLAPAELEAVAEAPLYVRGGHFELILDPRSLAALTRVLGLTNADATSP